MTDNSIQTKRLEIALEQYERLIFSICYRMVGDYFDARRKHFLHITKCWNVSMDRTRKHF